MVTVKVLLRITPCLCLVGIYILTDRAQSQRSDMVRIKSAKYQISALLLDKSGFLVHLRHKSEDFNSSSAMS